MTDWLRLLLMMFYSPVRGMREIRERSLAPVAFLAFLAQAAYSFLSDKFSGVGSGGRIVSELFSSAIIVVLVAVVIVPILTLVANMFERRGSFRVVITQEYAPVAATMFYVLTVANIVSILLAVVVHYSGLQAYHFALMMQNSDNTAESMRRIFGNTAEVALTLEQLKDPVLVAQSLFLMPKIVLFAIGTVIGVKDVFRTSFVRAFGISVISAFAASFVLPIAVRLFSGVLGSPFLIFILFMLLRGYFSEIMGTQRAKTAFKQNLESATLNPADASAHYNLGLIHQTRGELDQARERFERALQIDDGEIDASYQLGRIARQQKRYPDAIQNFEHVVTRDPAHSQYEIWREVAATYIAAGQFEDARNALEQFLEHRPSDPEGLYLMGRAHAGLGHKREATNLMQACIEAVKTAPAYKYRASKRWLNEAQQFIKGSQ
ncbi:MAG TPA: tetratricopeptide repeat protein [Pyrinomonadaceae bacterium]|nr:tetratricopeptide repeat protein [Pyrinomonadaceae bacterium]